MATVPVFPSLGEALTALAPGASLEARRPVGGGEPEDEPGHEDDPGKKDPGEEDA